MKFKIGDKVRSRIDDVDAGVYVGYIGTVVDSVVDYEPEIGLFPSEEMDWYHVEFTTNRVWLKANKLELESDETVITKYVVIYRRIDGSIVAYDSLFCSEEQARKTFEAAFYNPEDIIAINKVTWIKK